jgi:hypothetical protein
MSGDKEQLVLKGLESAKNQLDAFCTYFPEATIESVKNKIRQENELNRKEYDEANLGPLLNLAPK